MRFLFILPEGQGHLGRLNNRCNEGEINKKVAQKASYLPMQKVEKTRSKTSSTSVRPVTWPILWAASRRS